MAESVAASFSHVSKRYQSVWRPRRSVLALQDVSLEVRRGEVLGLIGPNRAGKSTLLKVLLGLCRASQGRVERLGRPVSEVATLARVGYMHENQAFPRHLTAATLLGFYGRLTLVPAALLRHRVPVLLRRVGLADRANEPIARFSKGMVQRLALAQALLCEPELLVLDEPREGLDLAGRDVLRGVVGEQRQAGGTVVLVSHALDEVSVLCDRVAVMSQGRLAGTYSVDELARPKGRSVDRVSGRLPFEQAMRSVYEACGAIS